MITSKGLILFLSIFIYFTYIPIIKAQDYSNNSTYLTIINNSLIISQSFQKVENKTSRDEQLIRIAKYLHCAKSNLIKLKAENISSEKTKQLEEWIQVFENARKGLAGSEWSTKPSWKLGITLVALSIEDEIDKNICKQ